MNKNENDTAYNDKNIIMPFLHPKQDNEHAYEPSKALSEKDKKKIVNDFSHAFAVFSQFGNVQLTMAFERFVNTVQWYSAIPPMLLRDTFKDIINPIDDEGNDLLPENASMSRIEQWFKNVLPEFLVWVEEHKDAYTHDKDVEAHDEDYTHEEEKKEKKEDQTNILYK